MVIAGITFLTPIGGVIAVAALVPAAAVAFAALRVRRVLAALRLEPPRGGLDVVALGALIALVALLGLAAAQPAVARSVRERERTDVQALFVVDVSGSMAASASPGAPTRLTRAIHDAARLRAAIPQVPSGIATLTDRVVPDLLPVGDVAGFDGTLERAVGIEQPPPEVGAVTATSFASLTNVATGDFFSAPRRIVVLLSDGESVPYDSLAVARAFARSPSIAFLAVHVAAGNERIYSAGGRLDPGYQSDPQSGVTLRDLATATGGSAYEESDLSGASAALRRSAGSGPSRATTVSEREARPLAPYVALAALLPALLAAGRRAERFSRRSTVHRAARARM